MPRPSETTHCVGQWYEADPATGVGTAYYPFNGLPVAMKRGSTLSHLHHDHLGSLVSATDASGNELGWARYLPFGGLRLSGGTLPTDRLFTGQTRDFGDQFYCFKARYYDAGIGQFHGPDTAVPDYTKGGPKDSQALNRYAYALNNPLRLADPSGHVPEYVYFVPGVLGQDPAYSQFLSDLQRELGLGGKVVQVPAYGAGAAQDIATAFLQGTPIAADLRNLGITHDPYAANVVAAVLADRAQGRLGPGVQVDLIGYSGGASVALDAAATLQQYGVRIANLITLGGYASGAKPANVDRWTAITGLFDPIGLAPLSGPIAKATETIDPLLSGVIPAASPDQTIILPGLTHLPYLGVQSYYYPDPRNAQWIGSGEWETIQAIGQALGLPAAW